MKERESKVHPEKFIPLEEILKKYPEMGQKKDNQSDYEPGKHPPKHCPNCGSTNIHNQELESRYEGSELYDTYCRNCEWSGDISPDKHLKKPTATSRQRNPLQNSHRRQPTVKKDPKNPKKLKSLFTEKGQ